eukprot:gene2800-2982_t
MVQTRSGKSTNTKTTIVKASKKISSKAIVVFNDSEFANGDHSQEEMKMRFKINKNSNRLSNNHLRFPQTPAGSSKIIHNSHRKRHSFDDEDNRSDSNNNYDLQNPIQITSEVLKILSTPGSNKKLKVCMDHQITRPTELILSAVKKDIFPSLINDNKAESAVSKAPSPLKGINPVGIKKMTINDEEKNMNGAPEGELYDVILLTDSELPPLSFNHNESFESFIKDQINVYVTLDKNGWAKQYEIITFLRQALIHHSQEITKTPEFLLNIIKTFSDGITSLRSANVRNSLLGCSYLFTSSNIPMSDMIWDSMELDTLLIQILLKSGSNPKFIALESFQVLQTIMKVLPMEKIFNQQLSIFNTEQYLLHRNLDISYSTASILHEKITTTMKTSEDINLLLTPPPTATTVSKPTTTTIIKLIYQGLTLAKKFQTKEKMKMIFIHFKEIIFNNNIDQFQLFLQSLSFDLLGSQIDEIVKEATKGKEMVKPSNGKENLPKSSLSSTSNKFMKKPVIADSSSSSSSIALSSVVSKPWLKNAIKSQENASKPLQKKDINQSDEINQKESTLLVI